MIGLLRTLVRRALGRSAPRLLPVGSPAPAFRVADHTGREHALESYRGRRVVLWFFPKADTPGCTMQGCAFRDHSGAYAGAGVVVLGASFDDQAANRAFAQKHGFGFPLLCDTTRELGLAYRACERRDDAYPRRVTYVIGADGRIEQALATQDPKGQAAALLGSLRR